MPDCKECLPLYLIRINFKNTNRVSLKGHDFILKVTLTSCSFYFVIMACDETSFYKGGDNIKRLRVSLCHRRPGQEWRETTWVDNSVASGVGTASLETFKGGS